MIRQWKMSQIHKSAVAPSVTPAKYCFYPRKTEKYEITLDSSAAAASWQNMLSVPGPAQKSVVVPLPPQNSPHCPWHALCVSRPSEWLTSETAGSLHFKSSCWTESLPVEIACSTDCCNWFCKSGLLLKWHGGEFREKGGKKKGGR